MYYMYCILQVYVNKIAMKIDTPNSVESFHKSCGKNPEKMSGKTTWKVFELAISLSHPKHIA